MITGFRFTEGI